MPDHRESTPGFTPFSAADAGFEAQCRRYIGLLDLIDQPVMVIGVDHRLHYANAAARRGTKDPNPVGSGMRCHELSHHRDTPCNEPCPLAVVSATGAPHSVRHIHIDATGKEQVIELRAAPILDADGRVVEVIEIGHDITQQVALERQERSLREQFAQAQKMETIGTLAGGVAHDFNNLLTIIMSFTEMARESMLGDDEGREDLEAVLDASHRAKNLIRQLLTFSRRDNAEPEAVDLTALVSGSQKMLRRLITETVDMSFEVPDEALLVWGDPALIQQVLINLAVNSRDAMPDGGSLRFTLEHTEIGATRACRIGEVAAGPCALITVTNSGCGMDEATVQRVFEPFYTTKAAGKGTGLGMAMVRGTMEGIGGGLELRSQPGVGTTIELLLPLTHTREIEALEAEQDSASAAGLALVVEDDEAIRRMVTRALEGRGWRVVSASDGAEGLARYDALTSPCDVVISDAIMPRLTGPDLALRLRQRDPKLPIVIMSGYLGHDVSAKELVEAGYGVLAKPFDMAELFRAVHEVLPTEVQSGFE